MTSSKKIVPFPTVRADRYDAALEKEKNAIGKRISLMRRSLELSLSDLSHILASYGVKVTASSISKWELGETVPNSYQLLAICHAMDIADNFKCFSSHYVPDLNSEGQKKVVEYKNLLIASKLYEPEPELETFIELPVSYLRASAGTGQFLDSNSFEKQMFRETSVPAGADFAVHVSGDSMEPVFHDGQMVFVHQQETLNIGDVGIFYYDGDGYIKVYNEQEPDGAYETPHSIKQIVLMSYNCRYLPIPVLPDRSFSIFGKVLL